MNGMGDGPSSPAGWRRPPRALDPHRAPCIHHGEASAPWIHHREGHHGCHRGWGGRAWVEEARRARAPPGWMGSAAVVREGDA
jgi:hypothetical protein